MGETEQSAKWNISFNELNEAPGLVEILLEKKVWAVVGANQGPEKYGNMIYRKLKLRSYEVYAVNPNYDSIEGDICYKKLSLLPKLPDVIVMVVKPEISLLVLEDAAKLGIRHVWFQPETYDNGVLAAAENLGLKTVQACVLVRVTGDGSLTLWCQRTVPCHPLFSGTNH